MLIFSVEFYNHKYSKIMNIELSFQFSCISYSFHCISGSAALPQCQNKDDEIPQPRSHSVSGLQVSDSPSHQVIQEKPLTDMQLKYDNDRLKLALAQR